jgi:hypothetical protein
MAKRVLSFTLDSEADRDLIRWLDRQKNRSAAIRDAIRDHLGRGGVTIDDVYRAVRALDRKIQAGIVVADASQRSVEDWDEPPEAAAALDALAEL